MPTITILPGHDENGNMLSAGQPPEQSHPDQIDYKAHSDNAALKAASGCLGYVWESCQSLNEFRVTRNIKETPAAHAHKVGDAVTNFERAFELKFDKAKSDVESELRRVEQALEEAANLKPNPRFEAIICDRFSSMTPVDRAQAIDELIAAGDAASLATLLDAPSPATGLDSAVRETIKPRLYAKVDPKGLALRDALTQALQKLDRCKHAYLGYSLKLLAGSRAYDEQVEKAEAVARRLPGFEG